METASVLTNLERKIITIIQHHNKRGRSTSLRELKMRLSHEESKIQSTIEDLIKREWIKIHENEWTVVKKLF
ncbi:hypothetical protein CIL05_07295 [Virgibacillus profundi]|uniref:ENTH domain-containing protein n=1 Tax=Virgibacillus profundi TaxID=2024555 RepID=A0A2A2IG24_9BACI|nr:hypothetical protein [Virgibacillus profundi]PAV30266.1 hypothetical protein CIL05_07295 [Virgibacillus profundi]PXY54438.1 hypothetical protein CIT14_07380 [Virgibacillus profundi]